jgi:hypothetical protein
MYYVRELLAHWPPTAEQLVFFIHLYALHVTDLSLQTCESGAVPWLGASTDEVEALRRQLPRWVASIIEPSSLSALPLNMGDSKGATLIRREYARTYLEKLTLDPYAMVQVTRKSLLDGEPNNYLATSLDIYRS